MRFRLWRCLYSASRECLGFGQRRIDALLEFKVENDQANATAVAHDQRPIRVENIR